MYQKAALLQSPESSLPHVARASVSAIESRHDLARTTPARRTACPGRRHGDGVGSTRPQPLQRNLVGASFAGLARNRRSSPSRLPRGRCRLSAHRQLPSFRRRICRTRPAATGCRNRAPPIRCASRGRSRRLRPPLAPTYMDSRFTRPLWRHPAQWCRVPRQLQNRVR